ncbi:hypothetical protein TrRE_jg1466 [Triparma retinervis]|uniref:Integrase catalytic domain-containing protein n=1 Tax=Triparma retinervis TaxID=2557542 RepID=A0A9W7DX00_9STRA|nr:hypothetical protein TrRE_jg1466 [Triparma retinervis]
MQRLKTMTDLPDLIKLKHNATKCTCPSCLLNKAKRANSPARTLRLPTTRKRSSFSFDRFTSPVRSVDGFKYGLFLIDNLTKRLFMWPLVGKTEDEFYNTCITGPNGLISILQQAHASSSALTVEFQDDPTYNADFLVPNESSPTEIQEVYNPSYAVSAPTGPSAPAGQIGSTMNRAHTDNEPSFITKFVKDCLSKFGVQVTTTSVHTPVNNAMIERVQRTIAEATRASLHYAGAPEALWSDHLKCNVVSYNFPGVAFLGAAPATADYNTRRKWDARGIQGIFAFYDNINFGIPRKVWIRQTDGRSLIECINDPTSPFHKPKASGHFNPDPTFALAAENCPAKATVIFKRTKTQTLDLLSKIPQALLDHDPPFQDKLVDNGQSRLPSVPTLGTH